MLHMQYGVLLGNNWNGIQFQSILYPSSHFTLLVTFNFLMQFELPSSLTLYIPLAPFILSWINPF